MVYKFYKCKLQGISKLLLLFFFLIKVLPEGSWYCSRCTCWICRELVIDNAPSDRSQDFKCSQCAHKCNDLSHSFTCYNYMITFYFHVKRCYHV